MDILQELKKLAWNQTKLACKMGAIRRLAPRLQYAVPPTMQPTIPPTNQQESRRLSDYKGSEENSEYSGLREWEWTPPFADAVDVLLHRLLTHADALEVPGSSIHISVCLFFSHLVSIYLTSSLSFFPFLLLYFLLTCRLLAILLLTILLYYSQYSIVC